MNKQENDQVIKTMIVVAILSCAITVAVMYPIMFVIITGTYDRANAVTRAAQAETMNDYRYRALMK